MRLSLSTKGPQESLPSRWRRALRLLEVVRAAALPIPVSDAATASFALSSSACSR